ncbi:hypothetical protein F4779DRAFT_622538 [Xylariaceae sp. FL0662B]|nr:hypothetical protein F4779DRAFT_622538 [Xylariaceae sp. FL0662B]
MAQNTQTHIPLIYRIIFTWIDPILCLQIVYLNWATPDAVMTTFLPHATVGYHPDLAPLFHLIASSFMLTGLFSAVLLRYSQDVNIWKVTQFCIWVVDVSLVVSKAVWLRDHGGWDALQQAENWGSNDAIGVGLFVARLLFVLGIGLRTTDVEKKAN